MGLVIAVVGVMLIVTAWRDTYTALGNQLYKDFTGSGNFFYWLAAISIVGAVGYMSPFRTLSRWFLVLILLTYAISKKGILSQVQSGLSNIKPAATNVPAIPTEIPVAASGNLPVSITAGSKLPVYLTASSSKPVDVQLIQQQSGGGAGGLGGIP